MVRLGWRARALDRFEAVRALEARVGEGVRVVPLDPHLPGFSPALHRDPHHGPASLEQAVTPDHSVPDAEPSQSRTSGLLSPVLSFRAMGDAGDSSIRMAPRSCTSPVMQENFSPMRHAVAICRGYLAIVDDDWAGPGIRVDRAGISNSWSYLEEVR